MNTSTGEIMSLERRQQILDAMAEVDRKEAELDKIKEVEFDDLPRKNQRELMKAGITKLGRNQKCACGSGKKFKKCCLTRQGDDTMKTLTSIIASILLLAIAATSVGAACSQDGTFNLSAWPANPVEDNVTGYNVYRSRSIDGAFALVGTTATPGYTDTVTEYGQYFYKLAAVTDCEGVELESDLSAASEAYTYARRPSAPVW